MSVTLPPLPSSGPSWAMTVTRSDVVLCAAHPELFRLNAFRITGLPVTASAAQVNRHVDKLRMAEKYGGGPVMSRGGLALEPPPDAEQLRNAVHRLHDPEVRLIDEFFWFWPHDVDDAHDEALSALAQGNESRAAEIWTKMEEQQSVGNVSTHNLAVLTQLKVLDLELLSQNGGTEASEISAPAEMWRGVFRRWQVLIDTESFWSRLTARIQKLDDPRLTTGTSRRIRESLPLALLLINAELAVRAAQAGKGSEAKRQVRLMQESGFETRVVSEALHRVTEPLRERIKTMCQSANRDISLDASRGATIVRRLLEHSLPLLAAIDCLLPAGDPMRDGAHDEVALEALRGQIAFGNKTDDWATCVALLEQVLPIAASASACARIKENLGIVNENKSYSTCFFCEKRPTNADSEIEVDVHGNVETFDIPGGTRTTWNHSTVTVPRCPECYSIHHKWSNIRTTGWLVTAVSLATYLISLVAIGDLVSDGPGLTAYLFALSAILILPGLMANSIGRLRSQGVKPERSRFDYKGLQERRAQGWQLGQAPPGSSIPSPTWTNLSTYLSLLSKWGRFRRMVLAGRNAYLRLWVPTLLGLILLPALIGLTNGSIGATNVLLHTGLITPSEAVSRLVQKFSGGSALSGEAFQKTKLLLEEPGVDTMTAVVALRAALSSSDSLLRVGAAEELAKMGRAAAAATADLEAATHDQNRDVASAATAALNRVDPERQTERAIERLTNPSAEVRQNAAERLRDIGPPANAAVPVLLQALRDTDLNVRKSAILALSSVAPEAAVEPLVRQLKDQSWPVREEAARRLGDLGTVGKKAVAALNAATLDRHSDVRMAAVEALNKVAPNIETLVLQLKHSAWQNRQAAAQNLGKIGADAKDAIPALVAAANDPVPNVQRAATEALGKVRGR